MLHVTYNGITVNPQRPEAPAKTFSSSDVPHGTDSVIVKACAVARSQGHDFPVPPSFTEEEKKVFVSEKKAIIEVLPRFDKNGNPKVYGALTETQILEPTEKEIAAEFYVDAEAENPVPKKVGYDLMGMPSDEQLYKDLDEAKEALIERAKKERAECLVERDISEFLIVPQLSDEFKAQFTLIDVK